MFANSVEDCGLRKLVPRLVQASEEKLGSEVVSGYFKLFVALLSVLLFLFWVIHLRKDNVSTVLYAKPVDVAAGRRF